MSKSNKIIITLAVSAFLIISLIVGLVVVFAEEQEPIVRNVNAVYRVMDADCAVSASYEYGNKASNVYLGERSFTTSGLDEDNNILSFNSVDNLEEKTLMPTSDIVLTKENNSVIFEFKFANNGENAYYADLRLKNEEKSNIVIHYSENGNYWTKNNVRISVDGKSGEVAGIKSYFVRVSLVDADKDYTYSADYTWTIIGQF